MKNFDVRDKLDRKTSKLIIYAYMLQTVNIIVKLLFGEIAIIDRYFSLFISAIFLILLIYNYLKFFRKRIVTLFFFESIFVAVFLVSILKNPAIFSFAIEKTIWLYGIGLPLAILLYDVRQTDYLLVMILKISVIVLFATLIFIFYPLEQYSMSLSYAILLPAMILVTNLRKIGNLIMFLWFFTFLVIFGSRGPLVILVVFIISYIFLVNQSPHRGKRIVILSLLLFSSIYFINEIEKLVTNFLTKTTIFSRNLELLINGGFFQNTSGRTDIYSFFWDKINDKPIIGWGILAENQFGDFNPHNIFLELLFNFGFIIGGSIIVFLFLRILYLLINKQFDTVILVYLAYGLLPLLLSNSYLSWQYFWLFIALILRDTDRNNYLKNEGVRS